MSNRALLVIFGSIILLIISAVATLQGMLPAFLSPFVAAIFVIAIITMCA